MAEEIICTVCDAANAADNEVCVECGEVLVVTRSAHDESAPDAGSDPLALDTPAEGTEVADYADPTGEEAFDLEVVEQAQATDAEAGAVGDEATGAEAVDAETAWAADDEPDAPQSVEYELEPIEEADAADEAPDSVEFELEPMDEVDEELPADEADEPDSVEFELEPIEAADADSEDDWAEETAQTEWSDASDASELEAAGAEDWSEQTRDHDYELEAIADDEADDEAGFAQEHPDFAGAGDDALAADDLAAPEDELAERSNLDQYAEAEAPPELESILNPPTPGREDIEPLPHPGPYQAPATLTLFAHGHQVGEIALEGDQIRLGTGEADDGSAVLDLVQFAPEADPEAFARKHALVFQQNKNYTLYVTSQAGTQVNDEMVDLGELRRLVDGDLIVLGGQLAARFEIPPQPDVEPAAASEATEDSAVEFEADFDADVAFEPDFDVDAEPGAERPSEASEPAEEPVGFAEASDARVGDTGAGDVEAGADSERGGEASDAEEFEPGFVVDSEPEDDSDDDFELF